MNKEAVITKGVGVNRVHYEIKGSLEAVFRAIAHLFGNYDPRGYSTSVDTIYMETNETYLARVSRRTNCD